MKHRMLASMLSLIGFFVAVYLLMFKLGVFGELACSTGGCETVQTSEYSDFLGLPVALYGAAGFAALFVVAMVGLQARWLERREPTVLLVSFSGVGVAYSAYLTYLEASVIHAWCQWCVASAIIITLIFTASLLGLLRWRTVETKAP